ncbi:hypothetical protein KL928_005122 [Ogataea angusta]|uniref:Geranylgeranyl pyrophosphate synthase n=1 Tax=Pichia angusta TaxID=870730 RepID=A0AAN6DDS3_PICAN|nr:uncharacterized protein KL928_005122 [Ogataea angusta]KAG7816156.1 hypothetical protein KL928_005122 [Ogataea angusta]
MVPVPLSPSWNKENEKTLTTPYHYLADQTQGKHLRSLLIRTFNLVLNVPAEKLEKIEAVIDTLHLSSLLIDDIEDNSKLRRSRPCSHLIFGVPQTINCANYMYFVAMRLLTDAIDKEDKRLAAQNIFLDEMVNLHRGQGLDLHWREINECPSEQDYVNMVMNKTGGLFRLSAKLMNLLADQPCDKLITLSNMLGVIYQIKDDYLNLMSDVYNKNKGYCEDITEGKFSFPIIHSINTNPTNKELQRILKLRTEEHELKLHALNIMKSTHSFEYCREALRDLENQAREVIAEVTQDPAVREKLTSTLARLSSLDAEHS